MPEDIKHKRGRPPKNKTDAVIEVSQINGTPESYTDSNYEFSSYYDRQFVCDAIFNCGIYDYFTKDEIDAVLRNPIANYDTAIRLSEFVYGKNGIVSNSIDYMVALMTLDRIIVNKSKTQKSNKSKDLMKAALDSIDDKGFIRDALFTEMLDGIAFYYFETVKKTVDNNKYLSDYEVSNIFEINEVGINASIITLPWQYTKIVGKKNGRYVIAFNLEYFNNYTA